MTDWSVLDLEWDGNHPDHPLLAFGWGSTAWPIIPDKALRELADPSIAKVVFTKADVRWLLMHGYEVQGPIHDVQVMAWAVDERTELSLEAVALRYAGIMMHKRLVRRGGIMFRCDDEALVPIAEAPMDQLLRYCEGDLEATRRAYLALLGRLEQNGRLASWHDRAVPYTGVLARMEARGIPFSRIRALAVKSELRAEVDQGERALLAEAKLPPEFNLASKDQLAAYLFTREFKWPTRVALSKEDIAQVRAGTWPDALPLDLVVAKVGRRYVQGFYRLTGRGLKAKVKAPKCARKECGHTEGDCLPSVSAETLKIRHGQDPWVRKLLDHRLRSKALQFVEAWLEEERGGRIYARFNQTGTDTGRLSSQDPNLQQVPGRGELGKRLRRLFRAPPGRVFVHADFNQVEPRLMAHYSGDPALLDAFARGADVYEEATVPILGGRYKRGTPERKLVQICFLAMGYGAQPPKIRRSLAKEGYSFTKSEVQRAYDGIVELYRVFYEWTDRAIEEAERLGYVETIGGHRRHIDWVRPEMRWKSENQAVNSLIQGSAANIAEGTMLYIDANVPEVGLVAAVHDEVLAEADEGADFDRILPAFRFAGEVGHGFELRLPLVFEPRVIKSWSETK